MGGWLLSPPLPPRTMSLLIGKCAGNHRNWSSLFHLVNIVVHFQVNLCSCKNGLLQNPNSRKNLEVPENAWKAIIELQKYKIFCFRSPFNIKIWIRENPLIVWYPAPPPPLPKSRLFKWKTETIQSHKLTYSIIALYLFPLNPMYVYILYYLDIYYST
jgi:hypothetical protein